jgi:Alkylmercury lyase
MTQQEAYPDRSLPFRVAALSVPAQQFHRALLRMFLTLGHAPREDDLQANAHAAGNSVTALLQELVEQDVIQLDTTGAIRAAYPFSGRPTPHRVQILEHVPVFAMCTIDALGLPYMVGCPATIVTQDPMDGTAITIWIDPLASDQVWRPLETVVLSNLRAAAPASSAECCCPLINAFTSQGQAERWQQAHPEAAVRLLTQEAAIAEARMLFEHLLAEVRPVPGSPRTFLGPPSER